MGNCITKSTKNKKTKSGDKKKFSLSDVDIGTLDDYQRSLFAMARVYASVGNVDSASFFTDSLMMSVLYGL